MFQLQHFAEERDWTKTHTPRNLMLAMLTEFGELTSVLQWNADREEPLSPRSLENVGQELADIAIYLLRLADLWLCVSSRCYIARDLKRSRTWPHFDSSSSR
jgi:NTP pyrophosphatase (non-canonical NTP hydrolase)